MPAAIDWASLAVAPPPTAPVRSHLREERAKRDRDEYHENVWDRLFRLGPRKRASLTQAIDVARTSDEAEYVEQLRTHEAAHTDWQDTKALAERILAGDTNAYSEIIGESNPFEEASEFGAEVAVQWPRSDIASVTVHLQGDDLIPRVSKSLLKSRKVSEREMPRTRFYELLQDHVCSCCLGVARGLFSVIPVTRAIVTVTTARPNPRTDHQEMQPVLSAVIARKTLEDLQLHQIDPSEALKNFLHRMSFKKTSGFAQVEAFVPEEVE